MDHSDESAIPGVPLSEMIETLRQELQRSLARGADQPVTFEVDKVELELKVAISRKGKAEGGVAFWVLKAGAAAEAQKDLVHTFKLSLKPSAGAGGAPLKIGADVDAQRLPGGR
jgi:hypothetical protein